MHSPVQTAMELVTPTPFAEPNFDVIRFGDAMMQACEAHLRRLGFLRVTVPRIVPAAGACENVDTLFEIFVGNDPHWFVVRDAEGQRMKKRVYFAQTGQLYLESLLGNPQNPLLYCVGPSARAERGVDTRHLTEFEMVEIEGAFSFTQLLEYIEGTITALVDAAKAIPVTERVLYGLPATLTHLSNHPARFTRLRYEEAIARMNVPWGNDLSSTQEQKLVAECGGPIFITHFPNPEHPRMKALLAADPNGKAIKFFNMLPDPENPEYVLSADCIVPFGGECVGSAARVHEVDVFQERLYNSLMFKRLLEKDSDAKRGFAWYIEALQRYRSVPHAGCGFGMSRIFQYILGRNDITKVVPFPSNHERVY